MYKTILAALAMVLAVVFGSGHVTWHEPARTSEVARTVVDIWIGELLQSPPVTGQFGR